MRIRFLALIVVFLLAGLAALAQESQPAQPSDEEQMQQMMEAMQKIATPGEHHQHLAMLAGKWTTKQKFWPAPGAEPMESPGHAEHKMILGGRYLQVHYLGEFMDQVFEGQGTVGYDNYEQKYVETWIDTMGTMTLVAEGTCDGTGKVRTMLERYLDPLTGEESTMRSVYRIVDADHYVLEMYNTLPDGQEMKVMEITHTRE